MTKSKLRAVEAVRETNPIIQMPTLLGDARELLRGVRDAVHAAGAVGDSDTLEWAAFEIARLGAAFETRWAHERAAMLAMHG